MANRGAINAHVDRKIEELKGLGFGSLHGRPLTLSDEGSDPVGGSVGGDHYLRILFADIGEVVGADFLADLDPVLLEQFSIMSVHRNESGGDILRTLLSSFMRAYSTPTSSDAAVMALNQLVERADEGVPA